MKKILLNGVGLCLALGLVLLPCRANTTYNVTLDMSGLPTLGTGDYSFAFEMVDGDGVANNTVTISNFTITDTLIPSLSLSGGASGNLGTSLSLPDDAAGSGFSAATQGFNHTAGSGSLSFTFSYTGAFAGGSPDEFGFEISDNNGNPIVSNPASNGGVLIDLDFSSASAAPVAFAADPSFGSIDPTLQLVLPEPGSIALLTLGFGVLGMLGLVSRKRGVAAK
jgi:hypothetical protein